MCVLKIESVFWQLFLKTKTIVLERFQIHSKIEGKVQRVPISHTRTASPVTDIPHQSGVYVIIDEPTLTHRKSPSFTLQFTLGIVHPMVWANVLMTFIRHYGILSIFTALKVLRTLPFHPSISTPTPDFFIVAIVFRFL